MLSETIIASSLKTDDFTLIFLSNNWRDLLSVSVRTLWKSSRTMYQCSHQCTKQLNRVLNLKQWAVQFDKNHMRTLFSMICKCFCFRTHCSPWCNVDHGIHTSKSIFHRNEMVCRSFHLRRFFAMFSLHGNRRNASPFLSRFSRKLFYIELPAVKSHMCDILSRR